MEVNYAIASNSQNVRVNILDVDTKELIRENFFMLKRKYWGEGGPCNISVVTLYGGTGDVTFSYVKDWESEGWQMYGDECFEFYPPQLEALGYDINSIVGNDFEPIIDTVTGISYLPPVINLYVRKL